MFYKEEHQISNFNYYHGGDAGQFSFFRIPRLLISDQRFQALSVEAKLLYTLLLDRMGLSLRSGWRDESNRVFIFYTLQETQETLSCGHNKATRLFNELELFGLIASVTASMALVVSRVMRKFVCSPGE